MTFVMIKPLIKPISGVVALRRSDASLCRSPSACLSAARDLCRCFVLRADQVNRS